MTSEGAYGVSRQGEGAVPGSPPYRVLDHTADLGVEVRAGTLEEALAAVAAAMFDQMADLSAVRTVRSAPVAVSGPDLEALTVNWLNELLYLCETRRVLWRQFMVRQVAVAAAGEWDLEAEVRGEPLDPGRHRVWREIKAATYCGLVVREDGEGWVIRVVFDL